VTFKQAKKELAKLAKGKYNVIKYENTSTGGGITKIECSVYIDGQHWCTGSRWEHALELMESSMLKLQPDLTEAPK